MGHKIIFTNLLAGLIIFMFSFNACTTYSSIYYEPLDKTGKRLTTVNKNIDSYNELIKKGFVSYIEFTRLGNDEYSRIYISLYTLKKYDTLKIHSLEFKFENKKEIVRINKTIKLNQENRLFSVEDNSELNVMAYFEYIDPDYNKIKIYMQNIFKKKSEDIGKTIDLTLKANYSFDNDDTVMQKNEYCVYIFEDSPTTPNWMYWLFPGM